MPVKQGDLGLLQHPASKELLESKIPARLAYVWTDGTPRVVPIWFHWNGREIVMATPPKAPKLKALAKNPRVSLTIDDNTFPHKVLLIRGTARLEPVDGIVPEYAVAAERYFGPERRDIIMLWRASCDDITYAGMDMREPVVPPTRNFNTRFYCQHYGKSLSVQHWEETCAYYLNHFPYETYGRKWQQRQGKAIHVQSDFSRPLYEWGEVLFSNAIMIHP